MEGGKVNGRFSRHPRTCAGDLRQPKDAERHHKVTSMSRGHGPARDRCEVSGNERELFLVFPFGKRGEVQEGSEGGRILSLVIPGLVPGIQAT